jgi:LysM repeat protein
METPGDIPRADPPDPGAPGASADDEPAAAPAGVEPAAGTPGTAATVGEGRSPKRSQLSPAEIAASTCPYLASAAGPWRGTRPSSSHRCAAEAPPAPVSKDQQRAFCLTREFEDCQVLRALTAAGRSADGPAVAVSGGRWGLRSTAPVVLEGPPAALDPRVIIRNRRLGAFALVLLMVVAFALVAFARLPGLLPGGIGAGPTASEDPATPPVPSMSPSAAPPSAAPPSAAPPSVAASPDATPAGSVEAATATPAPATPAVTPTAEPTATAQTYTVQRGDTLSSIARQFGTTVDALVAANGITDPSIIGVGQTLVIP